MKKTVLIIIGLIVVIVGIGGFKYYTDTYQGHEAYAIVPQKVPQKLPTKNDSGNIIDKTYSYTYKLTFVKTDGSKQTMPVDITGENPQSLKAGSYVKTTISNKRVLKAVTTVNVNQIPTKVLKALK